MQDSHGVEFLGLGWYSWAWYTVGKADRMTPTVDHSIVMCISNQEALRSRGRQVGNACHDYARSNSNSNGFGLMLASCYSAGDGSMAWSGPRECKEHLKQHNSRCEGRTFAARALCLSSNLGSFNDWPTSARARWSVTSAFVSSSRSASAACRYDSDEQW